MKPVKPRVVELGTGDLPPLVEVQKADMLRYSIVDVGAYPDSRIRLRSKAPDRPWDSDKLGDRMRAYLEEHDGVSVRQARRSVTGSSAAIDASLREVGVKGDDGLWRVRPDGTPQARVPRRDYRRMMVS